MEDKVIEDAKGFNILEEVSKIHETVKYCQNIIDRNNLIIDILFKIIRYVFLAGVLFMLSAYTASISTGNTILSTIGSYIMLAACLISIILLLFVNKYNKDNDGYINLCIKLLNIAKKKMDIITEISDEEYDNY